MEKVIMRKAMLVLLCLAHASLYAQKNKKWKKEIWSSYVYLEVIVHIHNGFYEWDWGQEEYLVYDELKSYDDNNSIIVSDTFYFTIDQTCYFDNKLYIDQEPLVDFRDFVETPSKGETKNNLYFGYWVTQVHAYRNYYHYDNGMGVASRIVDFLVEKSWSNLELRAIEIYNNNLGFESDK